MPRRVEHPDGVPRTVRRTLRNRPGAVFGAAREPRLRASPARGAAGIGPVCGTPGVSGPAPPTSIDAAGLLFADIARLDRRPWLAQCRPRPATGSSAERRISPHLLAKDAGLRRPGPARAQVRAEAMPVPRERSCGDPGERIDPGDRAGPSRGRRSKVPGPLGFPIEPGRLPSEQVTPFSHDSSSRAASADRQDGGPAACPDGRRARGGAETGFEAVRGRRSAEAASGGDREASTIGGEPPRSSDQGVAFSAQRARGAGSGAPSRRDGGTAACPGGRRVRGGAGAGFEPVRRRCGAEGAPGGSRGASTIGGEPRRSSTHGAALSADRARRAGSGAPSRRDGQAKRDADESRGRRGRGPVGWGSTGTRRGSSGSAGRRRRPSRTASRRAILVPPARCRSCPARRGSPPGAHRGRRRA